MGGMVRQVIAFLREHLLLLFGLLALLALIAVFWNAPAWLLAALALLQHHLVVILVIVGGAVVFGVLFLVLWKLPKRQASGVQDIKDRLTVENAARQTLAQIIGGAVLIAGLFFTWANLKITQEMATKSQETATKNQEIAQEGQITDRFTKAIAQLGEQGPEKLAVRLGGIYALERIARDSEKDHWPIMEVLTTYVREHAPWRPKPSKGAPLSKSDQLPQEEPPVMPNQLRPWPAADIQAILTVVGRRTQTYGNGEKQRLDLTYTDLLGADLKGAQLQGAMLMAARLERASLRGAQLQEAWLTYTDLLGADLEGAQLQGAMLLTAQLQGADLTEAQLQEAWLQVEQLATVKTLYRAHFDPGVLEQIQQQYPHLLKLPR